MKKFFNKSVALGIGILMAGALSIAPVQAATLGSVFKSAAQSAGQTAVQQLSPQAQQTVDAAKKMGSPVQQQNFIIAKAQEYLAAKNYQPAFDLANYVKTLDPKSVTAQKIMTDAKAALTKMVQEEMAAKVSQNTAVSVPATQATETQQKVNQVQADANSTVSGVKGLFGSFK